MRRWRGGSAIPRFAGEARFAQGEWGAAGDGRRRCSPARSPPSTAASSALCPYATHVIVIGAALGVVRARPEASALDPPAQPLRNAGLNVAGAAEAAGRLDARAGDGVARHARSPARTLPHADRRMGASSMDDRPALVGAQESYSFAALAVRVHQYARWATGSRAAQGRDRGADDAQPARICRHLAGTDTGRRSSSR